jgi:hypothetical protein
MATLSVAAQENATIKSDDVLYRGFANKVTIHEGNHPNGDLRLTGTNVSIKKATNSDGFIVKPSNKTLSATLYLISVDGAQIDTLSSMNYPIKLLPVPDLYWGEAKSGSIGDITSKKLSFRYSEGVNLPNDFKIVSWEISSNDEVHRGFGNDVSSAQEFLQSVESGTTLSFLVTVLGSDGIKRKVAAQWEVHF